jgi:hypothetical protein
VFNELRDNKGEVALHNLRAFRYLSLGLSPNATALMGSPDGRVLLAEQKLGRGAIFGSGLAFDSAWATLPLKPGFLSLVQSIALTGAEASENLVSLVAGERPVLTTGIGSPLQVHSLTGSPLDWKGRREALPVFPRSGVYELRDGNSITHVSVRSSDREGRQRFVTSDTLPALGKLAYTVHTETGDPSWSTHGSGSESSLELYLPCLLSAFLAVMLEGWLANPPPVNVTPRRAPKLHLDTGGLKQ